MQWSSFVADLEPVERTALAVSMPRRSFRSGEVLFWESDPGNCLHVIIKGSVLIERTTPLGDTVAMAVLGPDNVLGEQALINDLPRGATARAIAPTQTKSLQQADFENLRQAYRAVDRLLLVLLDERTRELNDLVMESRHDTAEHRVKRVVADLTEQFGDTIPVTQSTVAALAGTTRPTANAILRTLEESGQLRLERGRIQIRN